MKHEEKIRKELSWLPNAYDVIGGGCRGIGISSDGRARIPTSEILYHMRECYKVAAEYSDDPRTQIGARVVVPAVHWLDKYKFPPRVFTRANTWVGGVEPRARLIDIPEEKYSYMEHAEREALFLALRSVTGNALLSRKAFMVATCFSCTDCARAIIKCGIPTVIGHAQTYSIMGRSEKWRNSIIRAFGQFANHGVRCFLYDGGIPAAPRVLMDGEIFNPQKPYLTTPGIEPTLT